MFHLYGIFCADGLRKLSALLPWHVDRHVLALLVWHVLALCARHLALHLLGHLLADLLGHAFALLVVVVTVS